MARDRGAKVADLHRLRFDELDEHHVRIVEDHLADTPRIHSGTDETELLELGEESAGLVLQVLIERAVGLAKGALGLPEPRFAG